MTKIHKITLLLIFAPSLLFGQYSRSVYTTETSINRNADLLEINGDIHFVSVKESIEDTLKLTIGKIDENGNTSNYRTIQQNDFLHTQNLISVSGCAVDQNGNLVVALYSTENFEGQLSYLKVFLPIFSGPLVLVIK